MATDGTGPQALSEGMRVRSSMSKRVLLMAAVVLAGPLAGCATTGDGSASLYVKDAPTDEFSEVHVVFTKAYVHQGGEEDGNETDGDGADGRPSEQGGQGGSGGQTTAASLAQHQQRGGQDNQFREAAGWIELASDADGIDVNLLNATGTKAAFLGEANLSAGTYTQIAVVVQDAYGIDDNGSRVDITVPSGIGRVVRSFQIEAGQETQIVIDLELDRALTESSQGWKLTPVFGKTSTRTVDDAESGSDAHEPGEVAEVES